MRLRVLFATRDAITPVVKRLRKSVIQHVHDSFYYLFTSHSPLLCQALVLRLRKTITDKQ